MANLAASLLLCVTLVCLGASICLYFYGADHAPLARSVSKAKSTNRSLVFWLDCTSNNATDWERRIAEVAAHRENVTGIIPTIHAIQPDGSLGANRDNLKNFMPYMKRYKALGLEVIAFLGDLGGLGGVLSAMKRGPAFFDEAVQTALTNGYDGYNWDIELRGKQDEGSWAPFKKYAVAYMEFLNSFADALRAHGLSLSVDIAGCCGWKDKNTKTPAGHCAGAFSTHEFMATTCMQYNESRIDRIYSMSTYSGSFNGADPEVPDLKAVASSAARGLGITRYGIGIKRVIFMNSTFDGIFDDQARASIDWAHDLGVQHLARFMNEPRSQAEWDAWGYFLHN